MSIKIRFLRSANIFHQGNLRAEEWCLVSLNKELRYTDDKNILSF